MDPDAFPTLDPELRDIVEALPDDIGSSFDDLDAARELLDSFLPVTEARGEEHLQISDEIAGDGVPVRVYRPRVARGKLPGILYIHGGGFCVGSAAMEHSGAALLANELGALVVNVDYRLAPEHPYPAGLEDCFAALQYLAEQPDVDPTRLAVHGQSAGGGLAAATALLARDRGGPALAFQALSIPELDDRLETPSMVAFTNTPMWSRTQAIKSWELYLGGREADGYAAPARMADLAGLPPAYVVTCELDPLRDEGIAYASRLMQAGVSVELHSYPGAFHGVSVVPTSGLARRMEAELLDALRRGLAARVAQATKQTA
jgi:acetyl esterase/lipase